PQRTKIKRLRSNDTQNAYHAAVHCRSYLNTCRSFFEYVSLHRVCGASNTFRSTEDRSQKRRLSRIGSQLVRQVMSRGSLGFVRIWVSVCFVSIVSVGCKDDETSPNPSNETDVSVPTSSATPEPADSSGETPDPL